MKYLKDYTPSPYLMSRAHLRVDIYDDVTVVTSLLTVTPNHKMSSFYGDFINDWPKLELNGENLDFVSLKFQGEILSNELYQLNETHLVVDMNKAQENLKTKFQGQEIIFEIQNKIYPHKNFALEGLFQSGEILCTQCEPEGMRKITYFIDRPDVMCRFKVSLTAEKAKYPYLLSNGNRIETQELTDNRHLVSWEDPFFKPSYLFAIVAGNFDRVQDKFTTMSGREVLLEIYVDPGQSHKGQFALEALKKSMKWDEERFKREYDLDIYMIVAVDSFNFAAMENKGLNIFNSSYALADSEVSTDLDFMNVESVIGHEYFHNWTGNRITCRDWFQLTLKEGLTVFRDQEFTSDLHSRAVKRIEDSHKIKEAQFPEDQGPTSHPIRPESYEEINNFYTATIYEKGSEVIRMLHSMLGEQNFQIAMDYYFKAFDGQAITTEDFISSFEKSLGVDLSQFKRWYSTEGTPCLVIREDYSPEESIYSLHIEQTLKGPMQKMKNLQTSPLLIPLRLSFYGEGKQLELSPIENAQQKLGPISLGQNVVLLSEGGQTIKFKTNTRPVVAFNQNFFSPIEIEFKRKSTEEIFELLKVEKDPVWIYETLQTIFLDEILKRAELISMSSISEKDKAISFSLDPLAHDAISYLLDHSNDYSFVAHLFSLPTELMAHQKASLVKPFEVHMARMSLLKELSSRYRNKWQNFLDFKSPYEKDLSSKAIETRLIRNRALTYLSLNNEVEMRSILLSQFHSNSMTESDCALGLCLRYSPEDVRKDVQETFYKKWNKTPLAMSKWFSHMASTIRLEGHHQTVAQALQELESYSAYRPKVPNDVRAVWQSFTRNQLELFLTSDGVEAVCHKISEVDKFNPQLAARLVQCFALYPKFSTDLKNVAQKELQQVLKGASKDISEVISKII